MKQPIDVLNLGFGKAGSQLHLPSWRDNEAKITGYDTNPTRLDPNSLPDAAKALHDEGRLSLIDDLNNLENSPTVVDVVTSSGMHVAAIEQFLDIADKRGLEKPAAWLVEKPVVSDEKDARRLRELLDSEIPEHTMFVNENYNASRGVEAIKAFIEQQVDEGNALKGVDVVFYKNRVPDVLNGRFTDPTLGAFGIELPHQLAIAYNLAGVQDGDEVDTEVNDYYRSVHNVEHSEATYTRLKTQDGVEIRLAQGLGPFVMDASGTMDAVDEPGIIRYATAHFADGRTARVKFDPVPGVERFHSVVELPNDDGTTRELVVPDNTVQRVIASVALFSTTGEREPFTSGLSARNAINYSMSLLDLRQNTNDK